MQIKAPAAIAVMIAMGVGSAAHAEVYKVTDKGAVVVGNAGTFVQRGTYRDEPAPAPAPAPVVAPAANTSAYGAPSYASRALPEPGVVIEQAGAMVLAQPSTRSNTRNLAGKYGPLISAAAEVFGLDESLLRAVVWQESRFREGVTSPKGAMGLMQLMPGTARGLGVVNAYDPIQNVAGGARHLRNLLRRYGGDVSMALAAYNAGEGSVQKYRGIPPYRETQNYVAAITAKMASF